MFKRFLFYFFFFLNFKIGTNHLQNKTGPDFNPYDYSEKITILTILNKQNLLSLLKYEYVDSLYTLFPIWFMINS